MPLEFCPCCCKTISERQALRHRNGHAPSNVLAAHVRQLLDLDNVDDVWDPRRLEGHVVGSGRAGTGITRKRVSESATSQRKKTKNGKEKENEVTGPPEYAGCNDGSANEPDSDMVEVEVGPGNLLNIDVASGQPPLDTDPITNTIINVESNSADLDLADGFRAEGTPLDEQAAELEEIELWGSECSSQGNESDSGPILDSLDNGLEPLPSLGAEWRTEWARDSKHQIRAIYIIN
jgi:hypothetical protein